MLLSEASKCTVMNYLVTLTLSIAQYISQIAQPRCHFHVFYSSTVICSHSVQGLAVSMIFNPHLLTHPSTFCIISVYFYSCAKSVVSGFLYPCPRSRSNFTALTITMKESWMSEHTDRTSAPLRAWTCLGSRSVWTKSALTSVAHYNWFWFCKVSQDVMFWRIYFPKVQLSQFDLVYFLGEQLIRKQRALWLIVDGKSLCFASFKSYKYIYKIP